MQRTTYSAAAGEAVLINEHEAAIRLGLSVKTLRRWRWLRRGPPWVKIGNAVRYVPHDLAAFIDAGRQTCSDYTVDRTSR
jgi:hypothetical protein